MLQHMKVLSVLVSLKIVQGANSSCNLTSTFFQICQGSENYIKGFPSTFPEKPAEVIPTLTFLNLADINPNEKTVTVFVSLKTEWNDSRVSLSSYEYVLFSSIPSGGNLCPCEKKVKNSTLNQQWFMKK